MANTKIRHSTYAQIGDMGWREKVDGVWTSDDPDFILREPDRYDACAISAYGLYVDFGYGHYSLTRVYSSKDAAETAQAQFALIGLIP